MRLFVLFFSLLFVSCHTEQPAPLPPPSGSLPPRTPTTAAISYLALGDSYTIGEGVTNAERWPVQLAAMAQQRNVNVQEPDIIARTGWTTSELASAIASAQITRTYDLVSLLIGVNNQYRGESLAKYRTEFQQLLRTALARAANRPGRVIVLSIPDWGQSPFANGQDRARIGAEIDQFNAVARQECQAVGVSFIDITPITRGAAGDDAQFTRDRLHYSGEHMRRWADQALFVVEAAVK
ncbi:MAG TPA: SGNH/GDSL hydrolase family protein [Hymenobacter sp.]|jgi:lysophospholipase L1-like esterase|uniref:SGNH/GDSL hydrolase family protein n=1 Tax=Hymenobacter sp. TaxID=1898978 RepID=UPI002EDBAD71